MDSIFLLIDHIYAFFVVFMFKRSSKPFLQNDHSYTFLDHLYTFL